MADRTIRKFVYKVRRKLRRQKVFGALCSSLFAGLLVAAVISGVSLCIPLYYADMIELVSIGISVCVGVICGIYRTPSLQQAALAADALGYQEKISTALYLQGKDDMFSRLQRKDALDAVRQIEIRKAFPLKVSKRKIGSLVLIAVVFAISCMVDSPVRETAKQQHELRREVKEEIAKVNKVQKKIKDVSSKEAKQLDKQLEQIKEELTKVDSQESLQKTKERSVKKLQQTAQGLKDSTLRNRLQAMTEQAQKEQEEQKRNMAEDAAKAFEQAKDGSKKEKDAAYEKVKKYAQTNGNRNLEKKIQDYKDSGYSDADYVRAGAALDEAVESTNNESEMRRTMDLLTRRITMDRQHSQRERIRHKERRPAISRQDNRQVHRDRLSRTMRLGRTERRMPMVIMVLGVIPVRQADPDSREQEPAGIVEAMPDRKGMLRLPKMLRYRMENWGRMRI